MKSIRSTLQDIGAIHDQRVELFAERTRDREVPVWRDSGTGVIFIDGFYVGESEYEAGDYRDPAQIHNFENWSDTRRRVEQFAPFYVGRSIIDFGCGAGSFLRSVQTRAARVQGVELQGDFRKSLNDEGIACVERLSDCAESDTIFMFHVLEHLPDPLPELESALQKTADSRGRIVVEVPHARDFLLSQVRSDSFKRFTLWSQHLVLHTRDSLERLLRAAGFGEIIVYGVQRYGLTNHLNWLTAGEPGGHKGSLALMESESLQSEYASALARMDATDTLVAIAR